MHSKMVFNKPPLSIPEQIHHLRQKGLSLDNEQEASHYLTMIRVPFDHNESPFYLQAYIIHSLLKNSAPDNHWREKLLHLFKNNPSIPFINMGFSEDWEQDGLWVLE